MAETSFPFASDNGDRSYGAQALRDYFRALFGDGVAIGTTALAVTPGTGLQVSVAAGDAWVQGVHYNSDAAKSIQLVVANATLNRTDRIVLRINWSNRTASTLALTGTPSASPVAPDIVRTSSLTDISLATVSVVAGAATLSASDITDTRDDAEVCGRCRMIADSVVTAHASQHAAGAADQITPASIGAGVASTAVNITLTAAGWGGTSAPYTQTVAVTGMTAAKNAIFDASAAATAAEYAEAIAAMLHVSAQGVGTLTFTAYGAKPTANIPMTVVIMG